MQVLVQYNAHPLLAVAWEGTWGFTVLSILLVPFGYWHVSEEWAHGPTGLFEDSIDAFVQVVSQHVSKVKLIFSAGK